MNSEDLTALHNSVRRPEKIAFARWALSVLQETEHWQRAYSPVQDAAISATYEQLINNSDNDILEVIDLAFGDLIASYQKDAELDVAMDLAAALDTSLLKLDTELTERLTQSMLDQAHLLMMLSAAGQAAESRGLLEGVSNSSTEIT